MKIAVISFAMLSVFAGSSAVYADQAGLSVRNFGTTDISDLPDYFITKPVTAIKTGIVVYTNEGDRIGAVRALIQQNGIVKKVYVGTDEYSAKNITIENGRAIYKA